MRHIYLDHNATTPLRAEVAEAMRQVIETEFGNPSSPHGRGRSARALIDQARRKTAALIGARPSEIIFTSGGTEADNLGVRGAVEATGRRGLVISAIEHHAVLDTAKNLADAGLVDLSVVPVSRDGVVSAEAVLDHVSEATALVSVMHANNEVGTLQPIEEIGRACRERGVLFHSDAIQTVGRLPLSMAELPVDLLSISAHKFGGPKGVGGLFVRRRLRLARVMHGGTQERELRPGTENLYGIVGMGAAAEVAATGLEEYGQRCRSLRDGLESGLRERVEGVTIHGGAQRRIPNTSSVTFDGVEAEALLVSLDMEGVQISSSSACTTGAMAPSHVLTAMGLGPRAAHCTVRFAWGHDNDENDLKRVLDVIPRIIRDLRNLAVYG